MPSRHSPRTGAFPSRELVLVVRSPVVHILQSTAVSSSTLLYSTEMCRFEVYGDYYRGCGCFVKAYYSGEKTDCNSSTCRNSVAHTHRAPQCGCPARADDERRVINMFLYPCDNCKNADLDRFARR